MTDGDKSSFYVTVLTITLVCHLASLFFGVVLSKIPINLPTLGVFSDGDSESNFDYSSYHEDILNLFSEDYNREFRIDYDDSMDFSAFAADIQLQNMASTSPPPLQLINVGREDEQNEQAEEHEDEHDEDRDEENDDQGASNTLFSNMYHNSHSLLSAPSILMPLFRYSADNENQELAADSDVGGTQQQPSTSSQRPNNGDGSSTPQSSEQASSSQDATASSDNTRNSEINEDIPEGVDPSFLDALPPEMRREVSTFIPPPLPLFTLQ